MNIEEQVKELAKFEGWVLKWQNRAGSPLLEQKPEGYSWQVWIPPVGHPDRSKFFFGEAVCPPNYTKDLNAVNSVEKKLTPEQHAAFREHLVKIVNLSELSLQSTRDYVSAPAAQRVEALLKALNLYNYDNRERSCANCRTNNRRTV
jgi:hypothetical protein